MFSMNLLGRKAFLSLLVFFSSYSASAFVIEQFHTLPKELGYDGMLFHAGKLWVGSEQFIADRPEGGHTIVAFDPQNLLKPLVIKLPHAPQFIQAYGPDKIIVLGLSAFGVPATWQSHMSIITRRGEQFSVQTTTFPDNGEFPNAIFVKQHAAVNGRDFFSLRYGENAVMEYGPNIRPRKLPFRIILPADLLAVDGALFVHEKDHASNLIKINLKQMTSTKLFTGRSEERIQRLSYWQKQKLIVAATETGLLFIDPVTNSTAKAVKLAGLPMGLTEVGSCLAVSTNDDRHLYLYAQPGAEPLLTVNLAKLGEQFGSANALAYDAASRQLFVRATTACPGCEKTKNGLARIADFDEQTRQSCGL